MWWLWMVLGRSFCAQSLGAVHLQLAYVALICGRRANRRVGREEVIIMVLMGHTVVRLGQVPKYD